MIPTMRCFQSQPMYYVTSSRVYFTEVGIRIAQLLNESIEFFVRNKAHLQVPGAGFRKGFIRIKKS